MTALPPDAVADLYKLVAELEQRLESSFAAHDEAIARQAATDAENGRLISELSIARERQNATADILRTIANASGDAEGALVQIAEASARLFGAPSATIHIAEGDGWARTIRVGESSKLVGAGVPETQLKIGGHNMPGTIVGDNRQVHVPDVDNVDPEIADWPGLPYVREAGTRSMSGSPLRLDGKAIGALIVYRDYLAPFTDDELAIQQSFADQAAIAIENARLFNQVQQRTRELAASLDDLRTAQDRLVQTEKLASLGQLTAGIAHEIKNPLNFINNFAALSAELTDELNDVLKPADLTEKIREEVDELTGLLKGNLQKVVQHGKRADSIVKNMLLHSREGSGEHRPADINALIDESLNLAYQGARAERPHFNVTLHRDFDPSAGMVELFPQEITRVFLNLVSNGFYAVAKRKGEDAGSGFDPILSATTRNLGDTVEIRIRDNGTGIPPEIKDKMFNPFFTTKPAGEGTGLGLSMSHDIIVKQHGGTIDVDTEPGQFTEFRIVLPRTSSPANKNRG
ncbi:MAG: GAF domain-containing protein [Rhizobiales bacterium]|nr:GAF domain-containing protein [Hyphomicrobiales bacterium]